MPPLHPACLQAAEPSSAAGREPRYCSRASQTDMPCIMSAFSYKLAATGAGQAAPVQPEPDADDSRDRSQNRRPAAGACLDRRRDVPARHLAARATDALALTVAAA